MGLRLFCIFIFLNVFTGAFSQKNYTLSGTVSDADSGEDLAGATLSILPTEFNTFCNTYGFYSITLAEGNYNIVVQFVGYENQIVTIDLHGGQVINFKMKSVSYELDSIDVKGERADRNVTSLDMGNFKINPKQIANIPVLFGERDLIKTLQLMPGIKSAGEGNTGFYVRGGGLDQNLILLDEAPVYNASHLLGFFSVFNSEAIRDAELFKGSIPVEYGGRASSVLDIRMKEGNMKDYKTTGNVGIISSNLSFEGPVKKDVGSFIVSARRTYADLFLKFAPEKDLRESKLYFYDLNMKVNYKLNENNRLFISAYLGRDNFQLKDQVGFDWGSKTATIRLNHTFSEKLFSNSSLIFSNYSYQIDVSGDNKILLGSIIKDYNLKQDFSWYINPNNTLKFGANLIDHTFVPGEVHASLESGFQTFVVRPRKALESAFYLSNNQLISRHIKIYYGLRMALFSNLGPGDFFRLNG